MSGKGLLRFLMPIKIQFSGFVYGAEDNKKMILFCDDLNVATTKPKNQDFTSANELLRQLLDSKMIFNLQKPFDRRFIEGLAITAALSTDQRSPESMPIPDRLLVSIYLLSTVFTIYTLIL